ncbi:MAG TPA: hypothetical protein VFD69_09950 [Vicinamibacterales bacterium]|nr:hypothetical protein [Vicinamibacterales bacterium]
MSADTLNVIGLVLGFVGSWALVYEILWGYRKRNRLVYVNLQLANDKRSLKQLEDITDQLPAAVYSPQEKETVKDGYRRDLVPGIDKLEKEKTKLTDGHAALSFALAAIGMFILTVGFGAQLWAALLPKPATPEPQPPAEAKAIVVGGYRLPAFIEASASEPVGTLNAAVCDWRRDAAARGVRAAVVVGHYDRRSLREKSKATFGDNIGLAQRRADRVKVLLLDAALCPAAPLADAIAVSGGPRGTNLDDDRLAEIFGLSLR